MGRFIETVNLPQMGIKSLLVAVRPMTEVQFQLKNGGQGELDPPNAGGFE